MVGGKWELRGGSRQTWKMSERGLGSSGLVSSRVHPQQAFLLLSGYIFELHESSDNGFFFLYFCFQPHLFLSLFFLFFFSFSPTPMSCPISLLFPFLFFLLLFFLTGSHSVAQAALELNSNRAASAF